MRFQTGDFTGWTLSGNDAGLLGNLYGVEGVDPLDGIAPNSGAYQAYFADLAANATTISQTLGTVARGQYLVSWYLAQDTAPAAPYSNVFSASFGPSSLINVTGVPVQSYTYYSYLVTATSSSSTLDLTLGNDLGEFLLDDVKVVLTPEPSAWLLLISAAASVLVLWRKRAAARQTLS